MDWSSNPLDPPTADAWTVRDLVRLGMSGRVRIPEFQRPFRWSARDVRILFDSILRGYPIGSLLLWQRAAPARRVTFGPVIVDAAETTDALLVIDGQQRLTSLVAALAGGERVEGTPFELYMDLEDGEVRSRGRRRAVPATWLPVRVALDTKTLLGYLREQGEGALAPDLVDRATDVAARIAEHKVPVSIVTGEDEGRVREVFERTNATGKRLKAAEIFVALHSVTGGGPPDDLRQLTRQVEDLGFGRFSSDEVLRYVLAVRGGDVYRADLRSEFGPNDDPAEVYRLTSDVLGRVVDFLRADAAIPHRRALPYITVLPVLVRFFALHPDPGPQTRQLLRRWVWRAVVGWAGNRDVKDVRVAVRDLEREGRAAGDQQALWLLEHVDPVHGAPVRLDAVQFNQAATRVNIALLGALGPLHLGTDEPLDLAYHLDDADPPSAVFTSFVEDIDVPALANRLLHPAFDSDDGDEPRDDAFVPALVAASGEALRSHGFDESGIAALRAGDLEGAARARTTALPVRLTEAWERLAEPSAVDRPAITTLAAYDE